MIVLRKTSKTLQPCDLEPLSGPWATREIHLISCHLQRNRHFLYANLLVEELLYKKIIDSPQTFERSTKFALSMPDEDEDGVGQTLHFHSLSWDGLWRVWWLGKIGYNCYLVRLSDASLWLPLSSLPVKSAFLHWASRASLQLFSYRCRFFHVAMKESSSLAVWSMSRHVSSVHPACGDSGFSSCCWSRWSIELYPFFLQVLKQSFAWRYSRCASVFPQRDLFKKTKYGMKSVSNFSLVNCFVSRRFESKLLTILQPFPLLPFRTDVVQAWKRDFVQLLSAFFASSQYLSTHFFARPTMSQDQATVFAWDVSQPRNFSIAPPRFVIRTFYLYSSTVLSFDLHSRWVHPQYAWSRNDVGSLQINEFHQFLSHGVEVSLPSQPIFMSSTCTDNNGPCFRCTNRHFQFGTSSYPSRSRTFFKSSFPQQSDHTDFVQDEPQDLRCLTKISATCVVEDVSKYLDIPTLEFWAIWEHPPSLPERMLIRRQLSITVRQSCKDIHYICCCHLRRRWALFSKDCMGSRVVSHNVTSEHDTSFALLECFVLAPHFLWWQMSINVAKWTVLRSSLCFQNDLSFALYLGHLPCWQFFELLSLFLHSGFCIREFAPLGA